VTAERKRVRLVGVHLGRTLLHRIVLGAALGGVPPS